MSACSILLFLALTPIAVLAFRELLKEDTMAMLVIGGTFIVIMTILHKIIYA